jgi:hypothetical protein
LSRFDGGQGWSDESAGSRREQLRLRDVKNEVSVGDGKRGQRHDVPRELETNEVKRRKTATRASMTSTDVSSAGGREVMNRKKRDERR